MQSLVTLVVGLSVGLLAAWLLAIVRKRAAADACAPDPLEMTTRSLAVDIPVYPHDEPLHAE